MFFLFCQDFSNTGKTGYHHKKDLTLNEISQSFPTIETVWQEIETILWPKARFARIVAS